jgi:prepilin-type N-terminal cleavage/methylation domain-containing protein
MYNKPVNDRGFTLVEVILAVTLLAGILLVVYQILTQLTRAKQLADAKRDVTVVAGTVLGRMVRELQLAYDGGSPLLPGPGNANTNQGRSVYLRLTPGNVKNGVRGDEITFLALDAAQFFPEGATQSGIVQIHYVVRVDPEKTDNALVLVREETPLIQPAEEAYKKTVVFPLAENVSSLAFTALDADKSEWLSQWGERPRATRLPALIQIDLALRRSDGVVESFQTAAALKPPS